MKRILCVAVVTFLLGQSIAYAIPTAPTLKPALQLKSNIVEPSIYKDITTALDAADSGNWTEVRKIYSKSKEPVVKNLLLWRITTDSAANPTFKELEKALTTLSDWPKTNEMQKQAEGLLDASSIKQNELAKWFEKYPPITGVGKLTYAQYLDNSGSKTEANTLIKDIWWNHALSTSNEQELLRYFGANLSQTDHTKRVDMLIWTNQRSSAKKMLGQLSESERKLADARIGLMEGSKRVDTLIKVVPNSLQKDAGLLYERAKWRRRTSKDNNSAIEVILEIDPTNVPEVGLDKISIERRVLLRTLILEKRWKEAYDISAKHGLTSGENFAEGEFYAGWVALKYLNKPSEAFAHFDRLAKGVSSPISLARGLYWRGEALSALNKRDEAQESYQEAAKLNYVFYGQMAAQRLKEMELGDALLAFTIPEPATDEEVEAFHLRPVVQAAKLLAESGRLKSFERFSFHIDDMLNTSQEHQMLFDLDIHYLEPRAGVRNGKSGLAKGFIAPDAAFPVIPLPDSASSGAAEQALVLALSRQESELTPTAISHANARGMMQLLPATGRLTARNVGLPYRESWLTDDPMYNMKVGRSFLDELIDRFNGSYILALAAYNAGPSRPLRWIEEYGDPRKGEIDPIDFIECIPFSETRNYVQRILENTQVYRHRLSGSPTDIKLLDDLARGQIPQ